MNFKRVSTAAMALAMTASLGSAALAADLPQGWTPADGARGPMLISTNPNAGSYDKTITINDEVLEGYEYERGSPAGVARPSLSSWPRSPAPPLVTCPFGRCFRPMAAAPIGTPTPTPAPSTMRRI